MLHFLRGRIDERGPDWLVLDLHGSGLLVHVPAGTVETLPAVGSEVKLWTHLHIREDLRAIYGFGSVAERGLFIQLLSVTGVGPRMALAALSLLGGERLAQAIQSGDEAALARVSGVGKRTAIRIILELKGKVEGVPGAPVGMVSSSSDDDVLESLMALQFTRAEAVRALSSLPLDPERGVDDTLRLALQAHQARRPQGS